jgi:enamine deaminase RidA (YjgF/YER057c/UK114 family)
MTDYAEKIRSMNLLLPAPPKPAGSYRPVVVCGDTAYISGHLALRDDGTILEGRLGADADLDRGIEAARWAALNVIALIGREIGFEKFKRLLKVTGFVQTTGDFREIPKVLNGASDLFLEVFGENGIHARSAVGVGSLPFNSAVEIEAIIQIERGARG